MRVFKGFIGGECFLSVYFKRLAKYEREARTILFFGL